MTKLTCFWFAFVVLTVAFPDELCAQTFVHPGTLITQADINRMKAEVQAGAHPWIDSWNILINSGVSSNYTPNPQPNLQRGSGSGACLPSDNYYYAYTDTEAAYELALRWEITGDNNYANAVTNILNQWATVCTNLCGDPNITLLELYGCQFACVGEMMRSYTNWAAGDVTKFQVWMVNLWEPMDHAFLTSHDGTCSTYIWANWDLACIGSMMSIGILCDDTNIYNEALNYFKTGVGNGNIEQTVYNLFPGYLGQGQEEGRDQGHSGLEVALLGEICTMAYNQGNDLFAYENNRVLSLCEYFAKYNLYNTVPYLTYDDCNGDYQPNISSNSQGDQRPCWDLIYNHYVNLKGLAAPWSTQYAAMLRPDGPGGNGDELGFTTLTCSLTPIVVGANPSGLTANLNWSGVLLSWWGTADATNYLVKRATTSGGPYTTIATITTNLLTYTDTNVTNGVTYYYTVSALTPLGESGNATEVNVTLQPRLIAYYKFDESSGTSAADATGNGWTGILMNGATWTAGHSNNCVNLSSNLQQYVSLPSCITTNLSDFTIATWVNLTSISTWMRIFDFGVSNVPYGAPVTPVRYMLLTPQGSSGVVRFTITTGGGGVEQVINGTSALPVGSWHHVAVTLAGTNGTLYVDGAQVGTSAITITPSQLGSTTQNCIGKSQYPGDPYLNGKVDDFRIYSGALSAAQIAALAAGYPVQPPAPTNVVATAISANQIKLTWSPDVGATNYYVKRSTVSGGPYTTVSVPLTVTNFSDTALVGGTTYYYVIAAGNDGGTSNSAEVNATTLTAPPAPASLTAAAGLTGAMILSWPASSGATSYNILRGNFSGGPYAVVATGVISTGYTNTGLYGSVTYYYVVSASNANGAGPNSPEASATVLPIVWHAGANSNWDIGVSTNWLAGGLPTAYQDGSAVQFNDSALSTTVNLAANVSPISVTFSNQTQNYTLNSNGGYGIGGPASLTMLGSGLVTLNTANTFNGNIAIYGAGTLTIGGAGNLGGGNYGGNIMDGSALIYSSGATQTLAGVISGSGGLTKNGNGSLTLAGANNYSGATTLAGGTTVFSGNNTLGGDLLAGVGQLNITANTTTANGSFSTIGNTASSAFVAATASDAGLAWGGTYGGNFAGATSASGVLYNDGTFLIPGTDANNCGAYLGNATSSYGYLRNTGTATISGRLWLAEGSGALGMLDVAGGTFTVGGVNQNPAFQMSAFSSSTASSSGINVTAGTLAIGPGISQTYAIDTGNNNYTAINITGSGKMTTATGAGFNLMNTANDNNVSTLTLANGGELDTQYLFNNNSSGYGACVFNFNNGTLKATGSDGNGLINNNTAVYIYSGGATIDVNGTTSKVNVPLLAPSGNGVTSIALGGTTSGYVGAPLVKISNGGGKGAAAIANFDPSTGTVTNITVTAPGSGYTSAPTVTLLGGNGGSTGSGTGTATATATIGAVNGGGLSVVASSPGTLMLNGADTYAGPTTVNNGGELVISSAFAGRGNFSISNGATLGVTNLSGAAVSISNLTLNAGAALQFLSTPGVSALLQAGNVTAGGGCVVQINNTNNLVVGNTYPLVNYTGQFSGSFANLQLQLAGNLAGTLVSNANQIAVSVTGYNPPPAPATLSATAGNAQVQLNWSASAYASGYKVWRSLISGSGYSQVGSALGASYTDTGLVNNQTYYYGVTATNSFGSSGYSPEASATPRYVVVWSGATNANWNSSTTNWTSGGVPALYQDGAVAQFDDTALSNVTIHVATTVSPVLMVVSNYIQSYALSGSPIAGAGSLSKWGSNPLTLSGANTYSGGTTDYFGAIVLGASSTGSGGSVTSGPLGAGTLTLNGGILQLNAQTLGNNLCAPAGTSSVVDNSGNNGTLLGDLSGAGTLTLQNSSGNNLSDFVGNGSVSPDWSAFTGTLNYNCSAGSKNFNLFVPANMNLSGATLNMVNTSWNTGSTFRGNTTCLIGSLTGSSGYLDTGCTYLIGYLNTSTTYGGIAQGTAAITKVGTGTLTLTAANTYTGQTTVSNGELVVSTVFGGGGNVWVTNGATFGVTNLSGTSALAANVTVAAGTALDFQDVSSTTIPLLSANNVTVGGGCTVKITGANGLVAGNSYPLVAYAGSLNGAFTNLQLQMPYGWRGTLANSGNQISLANVAVVSTTSPQLEVGMTGSQLLLNWPADHTGWRLLMNTNLTGTNWVDVSPAVPTNQTTIPIVTTNGSVFYRMIYP